MTIRIQPHARIDNITDDGHAMTQLPYPLFVNEADGSVQRQDFWQGKVLRVVGFQKDLARHEIDLWWSEAAKDPQRAVGMYIVTTDKDGGMGVHDTAVREAEVID